MIPRGSESRQGTKIILVAIHTAEGATTAVSLEHYLDQPGVEASYHVLVDDKTSVRYLPDDRAAWAMLSGNHRSVQLCFTGFARWPRSEWLAHDNMLRLGAVQVRTWCLAYGIPTVKLTPAQVGADFPGVMGHWDWTLGKRDGTHTDPGPNFPWDVFLRYVNPIMPGDDMTPEQARMLAEIHHESTLRLPNRRGDGAKQLGALDDTVLGYAAFADGGVYRLEQTVRDLTKKVDKLIGLMDPPHDS